MSAIPWVVQILREVEFNISTNGYNISDVDNFIEELIDRLESAKTSNTIVYVPRPDFDQIRRSKHLFVLPQKGYNKVEVEKWLDSLSLYSDVFVLTGTQNSSSDNSF